MPKDDDYSRPLEIDEGRLDWEWLRQAKLTRRAGEREAEARHDFAQAKARLDLTEAKLKRRVRDDPTVHGLKDKPTEASISEAVTVMEEYQKALADMNQAKYELDLMSADVTAMVDKRKGLERLVELLALEYYSTDREPKLRTDKARETKHEATKDAVRGRQR